MSNLPAQTTPRHLAIIMDGNGRWARKRLLPRVEGHRAGAKTVRMAVEECRRLGIRYLTLYTFSTENWGRPGAEVSALMKLFEHYLGSEIAALGKNNVRLRAIGELEKLPEGVRAALNKGMEDTLANDGLDLILAVSYGGREELTSAVQHIAKRVAAGELSAEQIDQKLIGQSLYAPDVPDPDLLIRTSGECRISNFLLWQLAYAEIVISPLFWPEFDKTEFSRCLDEYSSRQRRFGLTAEQLTETS